MGVSQFVLRSYLDAGAPVLNGTAGSLLNLLNACLVSGYGNSPPLGWSKPAGYPDSSNRGWFQQAPAGRAGRYLLYVDDSGVAGGREAAVTGYATVEPSPGGAFGPLYWRKSTDTSATSRIWFLVGDNRTFYLFTNPGDSGGPAVLFGVGFGDFYSYISDPYRVALWGRDVSTSSAITSASQVYGGLCDVSAGVDANIPTCWLAARYSGWPPAVRACQTGDGSKSASNSLRGVMTYPNPADQCIYVSPIWIGEASLRHVRGFLRGLWQFCHPISAGGAGDTFAGIGDLAGRSWMLLGPVRSAGDNTDALIAIEVSPTVATNDD